MCMSRKHLHTFPAFFPIPKLDQHVIRRRQHKGLCWVDCNGTNVIWMCLKRGNLLAGVIVVHTQLVVVTATYDPALASTKTASAHRDICQLKSLDDLLRLIGPDVHMARVESAPRCVSLRRAKGLPADIDIQDPWFQRMAIDTLDSLAASVQLPL